MFGSSISWAEITRLCTVAQQPVVELFQHCINELITLCGIFKSLQQPLLCHFKPHTCLSVHPSILSLQTRLPQNCDFVHLLHIRYYFEALQRSIFSGCIISGWWTCYGSTSLRLVMLGALITATQMRRNTLTVLWSSHLCIMSRSQVKGYRYVFSLFTPFEKIVWYSCTPHCLRRDMLEE